MVHVNNAVGIAAPCQHNIDGRNIESSDLQFEHVTMSRLIQQKKRVAFGVLLLHLKLVLGLHKRVQLQQIMVRLGSMVSAISFCLCIMFSVILVSGGIWLFRDWLLASTTLMKQYGHLEGSDVKFEHVTNPRLSTIKK